MNRDFVLQLDSKVEPQLLRREPHEKWTTIFSDTGIEAMSLGLTRKPQADFDDFVCRPRCGSSEE
jgi:hypothetical protein